MNRCRPCRKLQRGHHRGPTFGASLPSAFEVVLPILQRIRGRCQRVRSKGLFGRVYGQPNQQRKDKPYGGLKSRRLSRASPRPGPELCQKFACFSCAGGTHGQSLPQSHPDLPRKAACAQFMAEVHGFSSNSMKALLLKDDLKEAQRSWAVPHMLSKCNCRVAASLGNTNETTLASQSNYHHGNAGHGNGILKATPTTPEWFCLACLSCLASGVHKNSQRVPGIQSACGRWQPKLQFPRVLTSL